MTEKSAYCIFVSEPQNQNNCWGVLLLTLVKPTSSEEILVADRKSAEAKLLVSSRWHLTLVAEQDGKQVGVAAFVLSNGYNVALNGDRVDAMACQTQALLASRPQTIHVVAMFVEESYRNTDALSRLLEESRKRFSEHIDDGAVFDVVTVVPKTDEQRANLMNLGFRPHEDFSKIFVMDAYPFLGLSREVTA